MNRSAFLFATAFAAIPVQAADFKFGAQTLTVPDGFVVELVAGPPLVDRPITCDFDEQGRLYVSDSSGTNDKPDKQLADKPHRIVRLTDSDGDGRFDQRTVFADGLMFPEGTMWLRGSLYVSAPPQILKLTDTNGDGVADKREAWFDGKTLTGCANDLHGPYRGPDGFIYWCKGAFAEQTYDLPGRPGWETRAAHLFRARPDGSGLEPVMTGGMDNPVDAVFSESGERFVSGTFFVNPAGGQRDGIIHVIYGGVYGKQHDVLDGHPRTGALMPIMTHLGPAAACGLARYESRAFGDDFHGNLFACSFNLRKITRHILVPDGATFTTRDSDFLVSDSADFHPTDVVEDADGSLLIVDTGGWYKLCCPTSQLHKPDVLGAIYRVRRSDAPKIEDPRGLRIAWEDSAVGDIAALLGDARPAVRERAIETLAARGAEATSVLGEMLNAKFSADARRNAVWALVRIGSDEARAHVRKAVGDPDAGVRLAAIHGVSVARDGAAAEALAQRVREDAPQVRRAAAEALGRLGDKSVAPALIAASAGENDRVLEHSITYALLELADAEPLRAALADASLRTRRTALFVLEQLPGGAVKFDDVAPFLASSDVAMRDAGLWAAARHADWGKSVAAWVKSKMRKFAKSWIDDADELGLAHVGELEPVLVGVAQSPDIRALFDELLGDPGFDYPANERGLRMPVFHSVLNALLFRVMAQTHGGALPESWLPRIAEGLSIPSAEIRSAAARAAQTWGSSPELRERLRAAVIARIAEARPDDAARFYALAGIPGGPGAIDASTFKLIVAQTAPVVPTLQRNAAASLLARSKLTIAQLNSVCDVLADLPPSALTNALGAFENASDPEIGRKLAAILATADSAAALSPDAVRRAFARFPEKVQRSADAIYARLGVDPAKQKARLDEIAAHLPAGDTPRGLAVFHSAKAACDKCHALGYVGGRLGPDLSRVGAIRSERDLLEAIVFPSASFVRSYEPVSVSTKGAGDVFGLLRRDAPDEVVLATGPDTEVRIARADIVDMNPGTVSLMPPGFDLILSPQELADLIAFLKSTK